MASELAVKEPHKFIRPRAPLDRRGSSCSAGCNTNQPSRSILRQVRVANKFRPSCRAGCPKTGDGNRKHNVWPTLLRESSGQGVCKWPGKVPRVAMINQILDNLVLGLTSLPPSLREGGHSPKAIKLEFQSGRNVPKADTTLGPRLPGPQQIRLLPSRLSLSLSLSFSLSLFLSLSLSLPFCRSLHTAALPTFPMPPCSKFEASYEGQNVGTSVERRVTNALVRYCYSIAHIMAPTRIAADTHGTDKHCTERTHHIVLTLWTC